MGGDQFEPTEENPMLGWRGASRYYDPRFKAAFVLECQALRMAREQLGLSNIIPMIPFVRTPKEARQVLDIMAENGLRRGQNGLKVYMMCEIPSNVILADQFLPLVDGFSIGSNDLTQLTLGLDRDNGPLTHVANERDPAVKELIRVAIHKCRQQRKYIGICGQAPSDYDDVLEFLIEEGIESISLNPDTVLPGLLKIAKKELALNK